MKKYKLDKNTTVTVNGRTLYKVKLLDKSFLNKIPKKYHKYFEITGYIESEKNLDQNDNSWICGESCVYGDSIVTGDSLIISSIIASSHIKNSIVKSSQIFESSSIVSVKIDNSVLKQVHISETAVKTPIRKIKDSKLFSTDIKRNFVIKNSQLIYSSIGYGGREDTLSEDKQINITYSTIHNTSVFPSVEISFSKIFVSLIQEGSVINDSQLLSVITNNSKLNNHILSNVNIKNSDLTKDIKRSLYFQFGILPDSKDNYRLYKKVNKIADGVYCSLYDPQFTYKLGKFAETTISKENLTSDELYVEGLHCAMANNKSNDANTIIEVEVNVDDIIVAGNTIRCKRLKPIREVSKVEDWM